MHEIQKDILKKLMLSNKAKYSELKSSKVEGNLFSYHLQNLSKEYYIELKSSKYSLTAKGKRYVDKISSETFHTRIQPKIVTLLVLKNKDKFLLYKRHKMPFINHIGFPYGKIHMEEHVQDSANRELLEKTGLQGTLKHRGIVSLTVHDETELISQMLCHIFTGTKIIGDLKKDECFWGNIESFKKSDLIPGVLQIQKLLKNNKDKFFFAEYFLNSREDN
jgi:ADP-ribose pyrophosphatase YjhB (NUDIX family)